LVFEDVVSEGGVSLREEYVFVDHIQVDNSLAQKTKLVPSPLYNAPELVGCTKEPALLGTPDPRCGGLTGEDLTRMEMNRAEFPTFQFPKTDVVAIFDAMLADDLAITKAAPCRVLTESESINGSPDHTHLKAIGMRTSSGFPYKFRNKKMKGKKFLFSGEAGSYAIMDPELRTRLNRARELLKQGRVPEFLMICINKDELRSREKILQRRTRVVTIADLCQTILFREYFGSYMNAMNGSFNSGESALGMNVGSYEWEHMIAYLMEVSEFGFAGDFKKFESLLTLDLMMDGIFPYIDGWYKAMGCWTEEDSQVRRLLCLSAVHTNVLVGRDIYFVPGNNKSGISGTTIKINNPLCRFFIRMAFLLCARKYSPKHAHMNAFRTNVRLKVLGDDHVAGVNPKLTWFNFNTVREAFGSVGVEYTDPDKKPESEDFKHIFQLQFLKLTTRFDTSIVSGVKMFGVPSFEDAISGLRYVRSTVPAHTGCVDNCNDVLRRCFGYGEVSFNKLRQGLGVMLSQANVNTYLLTWEACVQLWHAGELVQDYEEPDDDSIELPPPAFHSFVRNEVWENLFMERVVSEMLEPENDMMTANDPNVSVRVGPTARAQPMARVSRDYSVIDLCKRANRFGALRDGVNEVPLTQVFNPRPVDVNRSLSGNLTYWSRLYAVYRGGLRFKATGSCYVESLYVPETLVGAGTYADATFSAGIVPAFGPISITTSDGYVDVNVPFTSPFHLCKVPRSSLDYTNLASGCGSLVLRAHSPDLLGMIFVSAGDDFRFGFIREVPRLVPLALERKESEFVFEAVEGEMMQGGVSFDNASRTGGSTGLRGVPPEMPSDEAKEQGITFVKLAERFQFVRSFVWSTANSVGDILFSARTPWEFLAGINKVPFETFVYFRGDIEIRIQSQSQSFQQGKLIAYFVPLSEPGEANAFVTTSITSQTVAPHVMIPAGKPIDATLRIPFVHFLKRMTFSRAATQTMGTFVIAVQNALNVGASEQNFLNLSVFVSFPRADFQVLDPFLGEAALNSEHSGAAGLKARVDVVEAEGGVLGKARNVTRALDKGVDFGQAVAGAIMGFDVDAPGDAINPLPIVRRGFPILATLDKVEFSEYLAEHPSEQRIAITSEFGLGLDELSIFALRSRMTYFRTIRWTATSAPGDVLFTGYMCPGQSLLDSGGSAFQPTLLDYTCFPFYKWRGSLKYRVEFIGTSFQSGRLAFVTRYGREPGAPVDLVTSMSQYARVLDMTGGNPIFDEEVAWQSDREMLVIPTDRLSGTEFSEVSMGIWQLVVVNALQYNEAVAPYVDVNIYVCAGEDFQTDFEGSGAAQSFQFENSYI
jgi:hypothetical protein